MELEHKNEWMFIFYLTIRDLRVTSKVYESFEKVSLFASVEKSVNCEPTTVNGYF
jgi:hypothetical protein